MKPSCLGKMGLVAVLWHCPLFAAEPPTVGAPVTSASVAPAPAPAPAGAYSPAAPAPAGAYPPAAPSAPPPVGYQNPQGGFYAVAPPAGYVLVPVAVPPQPAARPPAVPSPSDRNHDGFYLRLSMGPGYYWDKLNSDSDGTDLKISGSLMSLDVLVGGAIAPGLILGGGLWLKPAMGIHIKAEGETYDAGSDSDLVMVQLGPFVDYYLDPKDGFHLQAAFNLSAFSLDYNYYTSDYYYGTYSIDATGFAIMGGVGYDFWISRKWSAGILANLSYSSLEGDSGDLGNYSHRMWSPSVVATFTLN